MGVGGVSIWQLVLLIGVVVFIWGSIKAVKHRKLKETNMSSSDSDSLLYITEKTIKYSGQVYQLKNITQVGKYKIRQKRWSIAFVTILIGVGGIAIMGQRGAEPLGAGIIGFALVLFLWNVFRKRKFLLRLETSSGNSELFTSKDEPFIDDLIANITEIMELEIEGTNIVAYTDKSKIVNNTIQKQVKGDEVAGDKFNNLNMKNSQIVNRSPNSKVTNTITERYGEEVQRAFDSLDQHIGQHNDAGSAAILEKIKEEIQDLNPDNSKVAALWNSLVHILPEASKVTSAIAAIASAIL